MTSPWRLASAPPGCRVDGGVGLDQDWNVPLPTTVWLTADTTPAVTVWSSPNGLPIAQPAGPLHLLVERQCAREGPWRRPRPRRCRCPGHRPAPGTVLGPVAQPDLHRVGARHHVSGGEDQAVAVVDDALPALGVSMRTTDGRRAWPPPPPAPSEGGNGRRLGLVGAVVVGATPVSVVADGSVRRAIRCPHRWRAPPDT